MSATNITVMDYIDFIVDDDDLEYISSLGKYKTNYYMWSRALQIILPLE